MTFYNTIYLLILNCAFIPLLINNFVKQRFHEIIERIIDKLHRPYPSKKNILAYLFKNQSFCYTEIIDIVGEVFRLHPEAYMEHLYKTIRKKIRKLYGYETLKEMEKTIIKIYIKIELFLLILMTLLTQSFTSLEIIHFLSSLLDLN